VSEVERLQPIVAEAMEPTVDGGYVETTIETYEYKCKGCNLVWTRYYVAKECEKRNHVEVFEKGPYGGMIENGKLVGGKYYEIKALRREKAKLVEEVVTLKVKFLIKEGIPEETKEQLRDLVAQRTEELINEASEKKGRKVKVERVK
jgi:hypothetical protein